MSITTELQRIVQAKTALKTAIEAKGVTIDEAATLDTYASKVDEIEVGGKAFAVRGYFTPEEDTKIFSVSGLPFIPETVTLGSAELFSNSVKFAFVYLSHTKSVCGSAMAYSSGTTKNSYSLGGNTASVIWNESSITFDLSKSSTDMGKAFFKAGYTYRYYLTGGFDE